jgi:methyl-accepting chemotaxis protein
MRFSDFKIGTRLSLAFAVVLVLLVLVAAVGWSALSSSEARVQVITQGNNAKIACAHAMLDSLNIVVRATRNILLYTNS